MKKEKYINEIYISKNYEHVYYEAN